MTSRRRTSSISSRATQRINNFPTCDLADNESHGDWSMVGRDLEDNEARCFDPPPISAAGQAVLDKASQQKEGKLLENFMSRRDADPDPWFRRPIPKRETARMIKGRDKRRKSSGPLELKDAIEQGLVASLPIEAIHEEVVDEAQVLKLNQSFTPAQAKAAHQVIKDHAASTRRSRTADPAQHVALIRGMEDDRARLERYRRIDEITLTRAVPRARHYLDRLEWEDYEDGRVPPSLRASEEVGGELVYGFLEIDRLASKLDWECTPYLYLEDHHLWAADLITQDSELTPIGNDDHTNERSKPKPRPSKRTLTGGSDGQQPKRLKTTYDPALSMKSLKDIVVIPEVKRNIYATKTIEPTKNSIEIANFLRDITGTTATRNSATPIEQVRSEPVEVVNKVDWRDDSSISNPKWYLKAVGKPTDKKIKPIPTFVGPSIIRNRPIYRALSDQGFDSVEIETELHGTDFILTPTIAVIFQPFFSLANDYTTLWARIKSSSRFFRRLVIVFEVVPYRLLSRNPSATLDADPLHAAARAALGTYNRAVQLMSVPEGSKTPDTIFALDGAEEVVRGLRWLADQCNAYIASACDFDSRIAWDSEAWAHEDIDPADEAVMMDLGLNVFAIRFIIKLAGSFRQFTKMEETERVRLIGPVVGNAAIIRYNQALRCKQLDSRIVIE